MEMIIILRKPEWRVEESKRKDKEIPPRRLCSVTQGKPGLPFSLQVPLKLANKKTKW